MVFKWIPKIGNKAAHVLAFCCFKNNFSACFVVGSAPSPFMDFILLEQTFFLKFFYKKTENYIKRRMNLLHHG